MTTATIVLWDLDGTLLEFREPDGERFVRALRRRRLGLGNDAPELVGTTESGIVHEYLGGADGDTVLTVLRELDAEWLTTGERPIWRAHGAIEAIAALSDLVTQTVVTGNTYLRAMLKLERAGLLKTALRTGLGAYGDESPDRRVLVRLAESRCAATLGVCDLRVIYVGDTPIDHETAQAEGAVVVLCATGKYSAAELAQTGAELIVPDLKHGLPDILRLVER